MYIELTFNTREMVKKNLKKEKEKVDMWTNPGNKSVVKLT